ncbi:MAG TPA: DUF448 domain-containing protein [Alphaproteobacteria bacterium]|nr:DUF448 domain-containing protein [Alphaproteobacteria bacterium]
MAAPAFIAAETAPRRARPRRDLASGKSAPRGLLVRFVVGPDRAIVPDIGRRLPGRGLWLSPRRDVLKMAAAGRGRLFARAAGGAVTVPQDLDRLVERLLVERVVSLIGLARRGGAAVAGFQRVREFLDGLTPRAGARAVLLVAADAAAPERRHLKSPQDDIVADVLTQAELGRAFGRDGAVYAAVAPGNVARELEAEILRLALLRASDSAPAAVFSMKDDSAR